MLMENQALTAVFANTTNVNPDSIVSFGIGINPDNTSFPLMAQSTNPASISRHLRLRSQAALSHG